MIFLYGLYNFNTKPLIIVILKNIKVFTYTNKDIYTYDIITRYNVDGIYSDCKFPDINQI